MATKAMVFQFLLSQVRAGNVPLVGGSVYFYEPGTLTLKSVWLDRDKTFTAANPYTLDENATAQVFGDGLYRVVIKDALGVTKFDRNNISASDFLSTSGIIIDGSEYATLNAAITAMGSNKATILIHEATTLSSSVTLPATIELQIAKSGSIVVDTGQVLTLNGWITCGRYQIFSGAGSVKINNGLTYVYPEWWGAVGDHSTECSTPIQAAIDALPVTGGTVDLGIGAFKISTALCLPGTPETENGISYNGTASRYALGRVIRFKGQPGNTTQTAAFSDGNYFGSNFNGTLLYTTGSNNIIELNMRTDLLPEVWNWYMGLRIEDISFQGRTTSGCTAIKGISIAESTFKNLTFHGFDKGIDFSYTVSENESLYHFSYNQGLKFINCKFSDMASFCIDAGKFNDDLYVEGMYVGRNGHTTSTTCEGIRFSYARGVTITGGIINTCLNAVYAYKSNAINIKGVYGELNKVFFKASSAQNVSIENSHIYFADTCVIAYLDYTSNLILRNNILPGYDLAGCQAAITYAATWSGVPTIWDNNQFGYGGNDAEFKIATPVDPVTVITALKIVVMNLNGEFTPVLTSFTVTGTPVLYGAYHINNNVITYNVSVTTDGVATTTSDGSTSLITGFPYAPNSSLFAIPAIVQKSESNIGGVFYTDSALHLPAWTESNDNIYVTVTYPLK